MRYDNGITYIAGLDLGQVNDYTALAVLERQEYREPDRKATYKIRHLDRWLGVPYPEQVKRVVSVLEAPTDAQSTVLVVDKTGVGRPVVDMFKEAASCPVMGYTITAGNVPTSERGSYTVPKADLVATVHSVGGMGRLKYPPSLPHSGVLDRELLMFRVKVSDAGRASWNAREGEHDDMLLALSLALWWGETNGRPQIVHINLYG